MKHIHKYTKQKSGVSTCPCGAFKHKPGGVAIEEIRSKQRNKLYYVRVDMYINADSEGSAEDKAIQILDNACASMELHQYDICERGETK